MVAGGPGLHQATNHFSMTAQEHRKTRGEPFGAAILKNGLPVDSDDVLSAIASTPEWITPDTTKAEVP